MQRLAAADVVVWAASLVPAAVLDHCRDGVEVHDSKSMTLATGVRRVRRVTPTTRPSCDCTRVTPPSTAPSPSRSPGAGPTTGRSRSCPACRPCPLRPPPPAASSPCPASRSRSCSPAWPTARRRSMPDRETIRLFAAAGATMAVFLSVAQVERLADELLAGDSGYDADTPVVIGHRVSQPDERLLVTTIAGMVDAVRLAGLDATTMFLVGPALDGAGDLSQPRLRGRLLDPLPHGDGHRGVTTVNRAPLAVVGVVGGEVFGAGARRLVERRGPRGRRPPPPRPVPVHRHGSGAARARRCPSCARRRGVGPRAPAVACASWLPATLGSSASCVPWVSGAPRRIWRFTRRPRPCPWPGPRPA